ncbi:MAG: hypothetical protein KC468_25810 [Myxococcales bacterium]|nr:hypothetical protein [Myxococcales bacterium]
MDENRNTGPRASSSPLHVVVLAGALSGVALRLGWEPYGAWPAIWLGALPLCLVLRRSGAWKGAAAGLAFGLAYAAVVPLAVAKWGGASAAILWILPSLLFAAVFGIAGGVAAAVDPRARFLVPALVWSASAFVLDQLLYGSVLLVSPLQLQPLGVARWIGVFGTAVLAWVPFLVPTLVMAMLERRSILRWFAGGAAVAGGVVALASPAAVETSLPTAHLLAVQSSVPADNYARAGSELATRVGIEAHLDRLVERATEREPGTIIWPENGNGLPNPQLDRRLEIFKQQLSAGRHDLLVSGPEYAGDTQRLTVTLVDRRGVVASARKATTVPLAEADLEPGAPTVLETREGPLGISICYESIFGRHVRALAQAGAEVLVVTSDEASFGLSTLPVFHVGHTVARAMEVGRSAVFVMNHGPALAYDAASGTFERASSSGQRGVVSLRVARRSDTTLAMRGGRHLLPLAAFVWLTWLLRGATRRSTPEAPTSRHAAAWALLTTLVSASLGGSVAVAVELWGAAKMHGVEVADVANDLARRLSPLHARDGLGPLFVQSRDGRCGQAALALGLTVLGDMVSEQQLAEELGRDGERT